MGDSIRGSTPDKRVATAADCGRGAVSEQSRPFDAMSMVLNCGSRPTPRATSPPAASPLGSASVVDLPFGEPARGQTNVNEQQELQSAASADGGACDTSGVSFGCGSGSCDSAIVLQAPTVPSWGTRCLPEGRSCLVAGAPQVCSMVFALLLPSAISLIVCCASLIGWSANFAMEAPSTGVFLANSFGVVVTSALSYVWTAAAVLRSQAKPGTRSTSDGNLENGCDMWLHECATSSADGTYTQAKEAICTMAAPERCSPYFEEKKNRGPPSLWFSYNTRQGSNALGGRSSGYVALTSSVSVTGLRSATISVSKLSVLLASNTLGWIAVYLVFRVVKRACTLGLRAARVANDDAGGNPAAVGGNGLGIGGGMVVLNAPLVAVAAAGGGAAGVGGSGEEHVAVNEGVQQASIPSASGSLPPLGGGHHDADPDAAIGDGSNSSHNEPAANNRRNKNGKHNGNNEPGGGSSIGPGRGSPDDLKACPAVSPGSPVSAPLCEMSPGRVRPSPSKSRPLSPQDVSSATKGDSPVRVRSQSDVGAKAGEMSGNGLNRSHNVPFMIGEGKGEVKTRRISAPEEGARCFDSAVEVASFATPPPGLASPPNVRSGLFRRADAVKALEASSPGPASPATRWSAKPVRRQSGTQVKRLETSSSSESRTGEKIVEAPDLVAVPGKAIGGACRTPNPTNSPGRAKSMGEGGVSNNGGNRDTGLASPVPVIPAAGANPALSTPTYSKAEASGGDIRQEGGAIEHPVQNDGAANGQRRTFSEAERDLRNMIGLGSPDASASANPPVPGSDGLDSPHSSEPIPDLSGPDTPGSGPPVLDTLILGAPSSSSTSTTYSACWIVLPEGATNTTSLQGLSDLDVGVASSAGWGGEVTQYSIGGFGGSPHDEQISTHEIVDQGVEEFKGSSEEPHGNWAPPVGIEVDRVGFDSFLLDDSDDDQSRSDAVRGGAAEGKGPAPYRTPSAEIGRQLQDHACSDGIGGGVLEEKGARPNQLPPPEIEQVFELAPRACLYRRESGAAEEKGLSTYRVSSAESDGDIDAHTRSGRIEGGVTDENGARASSTTTPSFDRLLNPNQSVNHVPLPPGSRPPRGGNHNADRGYAISGCNSNGHRKPGYNHENSNAPDDTSSNRIPDQRASIRPGGLSPADLKPSSAGLPESLLSALPCHGSPRRGAPSRLKSRPPLLHDISGGIQPNFPVRSRSQGDIADNEHTTFYMDQSGRHSAPFAIDEGVAETDKRGRAVQREGARSFGSAVEGTALTATSSGFASPGILRRAKLASSKSVAQGTPVHQLSLPSKYRSGDMDVVTSNLFAAPDNSSGNDDRDFSRTNSSGGAKTMGEDVEKNNEGRRDIVLGMPSTVLPPAGFSAVAESKAASSCHMSSAETKAELETPARPKGMGGGHIEEMEISPYHMSPADTAQDLDTPAHAGHIERGAPMDTGGSPCRISPAETNEDVTNIHSLGNASDIANLTGVDRTLDKGDGSDKSFTSRAPVSPPTGSCSAATAHIFSETKASGEGSSRERYATDDPVSSSRATNDRAMQCLEEERELRTVLGLRLHDISAMADTLGTEPEAGSTHSSAPISGGPANEASVADGPESQAQVSGASAPDVPAPCTPGSDVSAPDAPSLPFSTHSACATMLPEGFTIARSLGGVSDLDVDMASPAGRGSALTQYFDGGHSGPLHRGKMSSRETVDQLGDELKGGSVESLPISTLPIEINDNHLGLEGFLLIHSDDGHPHSDGIAGGVAEEEEGSASNQRPPTAKSSEIKARVRSDGMGDKKGVPVPSCQTSPTENGRELDPHARSDVVSRGDSGASTEQMSSAEKERELKIVLGLIPAFDTAQPTMASEPPPSPTSSSEPRWGNMTTTVSLEERQRRDQALYDAVQRRRETGPEEEWVEAQPALFPDENTWPSGEGFAELDGPGDRLPPPSDYEVQESAKMYARYEEAMRELGLDP